MAFKVIWSEFAENQLDEIFNYFNLNISPQIAKKLVSNILHHTQKLERTPRMGQKESLLNNRIKSYRYLIHTNYKIIYSVLEKDKKVHIHDVFDTRQNPVKLERSIS